MKKEEVAELKSSIGKSLEHFVGLPATRENLEQIVQICNEKLDEYLVSEKLEKS